MLDKTKVKLADIRTDGGTQPRFEIDESLVAEYADAMTEGAEFPPVVTYFDGVAHWLADGFHRVHAARKIGMKEVHVEQHHGTKRDAVLYSVGANADHGMRRTNADKRKAVMTLLEDEEWSEWSDREIARHCAVSPDTVGRLRKEYESLSESDSEDKTPTPRTYTTKHGTQAKMNTENIGRRQPESPPADISSPDKPKSRGKGIRFAHEAINALKKIPDNDSLRDDAFDMVIDWIETNR